MSECEGFICPYCLVGFATSGKLQNHFVDMHSGQGQAMADDYEEVEYVEDDVDQAPPPIIPQSSLGHQFQVVRQSRPKSCDTCSDIIWQDGLTCQVCNVTVHTEHCLDKLTAKCTMDSVFEAAPVEDRRSSGPGQTPKGLLPLVRRQVAKGRDRYVNDEFDLDLTYITERIIAMSFPASGMESAYRNNLKDVAKMLKTKHEENYMIFNLSERSYDISRFNNQVLDFGWPDHLAPSLERLSSVCKSIKSWLDSEPLHVAVVHCKGGKGRTGCVIAAFMHYTEICHSAAAALDRFAMKRFYDNKMGGVTQPSQKKYVHYFADVLSGTIDIQSPPVVLQHVLLHGIPNFDGKGGCRVFLKIYVNMKLVHTSGLYVCSADKQRLKISIYGGLQLSGEVLLKCFHKKGHGMDSIFRCQFPSAIVKDDLRLVYGKADLDDAFKDKRFPDNTKVELIFGEASDANGDSGNVSADIRSSLLDNKTFISNGATDLSHDHMACRDSYIAFPGGSDNGLPADDVPDLMSHDEPKSYALKSNRERSESSTSFQMDPNDIERVTHRSEVYTVISKPFKQAERDPSVRPYRSTDTSTANLSSSSVQGSKYGRKTSEFNSPPSRPPPPHVLKKYTSVDSVSPPLKPTPSPRPPPPSCPAPLPPSDASILLLDTPYLEDVDYAEVDDEESSSADSSPFHRPGASHAQVKQSANQDKWSRADAGHSQNTPTSPTRVGEHGHGQKPTPPTRSTEHAQKPPQKYPQKPPQKPPPPNKPADLMREQKKLELHQKYSKIREELVRKQDSPGDTPGGKHSPVGVAGLGKHSPGGVAGPRKHSPVGVAGSDRGEKPTQRTGPKGNKLRSRPSYAEVEPDFEIIVEPVPNRMSQPDADNIWMRVKYPMAPKKVDSIGRRSSSSSNLTNSDYYSNLAELQLEDEGGVASEGSGVDSLGRRRHSFTEGEDRLVIRASTASRDSVIDINNRALSDNDLDQSSAFAAAAPRMDNPDYKNLQYNADGSLSMEDENAMPASSFSEQIKGMGNISSGGVVPAGHSYENTRMARATDRNAEDYMNDNPEGWDHIYSNQDDLLMQVHADNQPLPEEVEKALPLDTSQRLRLGSGASILRFLKNNILKPKQPTEIHSGNIPEGERDKTLAPFAMSGIEAARVNKDYEAFFTSAWGQGASTGSQSAPMGGQRSASANEMQPPSSDIEPASRWAEQPSGQAEKHNFEQASRRERHSEQASFRGERHAKEAPGLVPPLLKPRSKTSEDVLGEQREERFRGVAPLVSPHGHGAKRAPLLPPTNTGQHKQHERPPPPPHSRVAHPTPPTKTTHPTKTTPPTKTTLPTKTSPSSPPSASPHPMPRPHARLKASNSDAPALPKARVRDMDRADRAQSIEPPNIAPVRKRGGPPPVPPPPFHNNNLESQVRSLMSYWYKPKIGREEAIGFVHPMNTGSFIVRDSSTVKGGYALTLKITEAIVRVRKKLSADEKVTEDMLVTHFLIQPDPVGVKLQGWSEKPFKSLPAFIASHVTEKLCLPCKLMLPEAGGTSSQGTRRQPAGMVKAMHSGAACDLIFLGSVDVASPGSDVLLTQTVQQLQSLDLSSMNIVTISVSKEGVTLQENVNGASVKRQYSFSQITYCGLDPVSRWSFPCLHDLGETVSLTDKICFGIVHRPMNSFGFSCMVFAEYDNSQPVSSVVNFVQKMMREHKHSSKYLKT